MSRASATDRYYATWIDPRDRPEDDAESDVRFAVVRSAALWGGFLLSEFGVKPKLTNRFNCLTG
ncbi:hypothetical protein AGR6A_Cc60277 [Agrobacterium sp. NCPPB 925]|nr:hypothetical protein AGR6A_Cc60277 [Agrobacterium sp. NCPPB 925]